MPTIAFASPKGGAGKSTSAVLLGADLALRGTTVTIIDADPNHPVSRWGKRPGRPENLTVIADVTEETLIDVIEDAAGKTAFVIIDLEGTASSLVGIAMSRADLVIIPTKGSDLDASEAGEGNQIHPVSRKELPPSYTFAVLFTQTSPAIRPRTQANIEAEMLEQGIPMFATQIHERDAYRAIFTYGGTLGGLDPNQVRNIASATLNARSFTNEVIARLDAQIETNHAAEVA
jgi:chromosome partitioning protein